MNLKSIRINNRIINRDVPPFIIAEMSANHNQSLESALKIVRAAAKSGVDAIKLQTYTADTMTIDVKSDNFKITSNDSLWKGQYLYDLYKKAYTPWEWHKEIFEYATSLGLIAFSAPFDDTSVDFLEKLDIPCYKIASFEILDLPLIERVGKTNKPMFISTGLATKKEITEAVDCARDSGCKDLVLLKCTSSYPALAKNANILTINDMSSSFNCWVGLSDHTLGTATSIASVAIGAVAIEKHITLSDNCSGVDDAFSIDEKEFEVLCGDVTKAWNSIGDVTYGPTESEIKSLKFRRTLYVVENLSKGDILTKQNLKRIRPGYGAHPKYYKGLLGQRVNRELPKGTPMDLSFIDNQLV